MPDRTRVSVLLLAVAVAVLGVTFGPPLVAAAREPTLPPQGPSNDAAVPIVAVEPPTRLRMARSLNVPATVEAFEVAEIRAMATGYVTKLHTDIGADVKAGDPLLDLAAPELVQSGVAAKATLDARRAQLAAAQTGDLAAARAGVAQAEQRLEVARSEAERREVDLALADQLLQRRQRLFDDQAITEEALEEGKSQFAAAKAEAAVAAAKIGAAEADLARARAGVEVAQAAIRIAEAEVARATAELGKAEAAAGYAKVTAPFDGVVTKRMVNRGDLVQAATSGQQATLFVVQRIDQVRVVFAVPEVDQPFVQVGTGVTVRPYAPPGVMIESVVARVASALDPDTRTMRAEIDLPNPRRSLLAGMYAQIEVEIDPRPNALTVPAKAVLSEAGASYVYVVRDGKAVRIEVKTGLDDGMRTEIREGLRDTDRVIVAGQGQVTNGARVREAQKSASPAGQESGK